jgi:uncharacterized membrane protein YoaK (UPF0700 family)
MLSKYSNSRTFADNLKLGALTAFSAGMVNVASLLVFFAFTSNVTGHYAILAAEIVKGNVYQIAIVFSWIFLFFFGGFVSNFVVIHFNKKNTYVAHAFPIVLEIMCLIGVGFYGQFYYKETLFETEILISLMLFAMGLQNGLTASISNFAVKTTHLTGATTELGVLFSMFTKSKFRNNLELVNKAKLLFATAIFYLFGGVVAGYFYFSIEFKVFYLVSCFLIVIIFYDWYKLKLKKYLSSNNETNLNKKSKLIKIEDLQADVENKKEESTAL